MTDFGGLFSELNVNHYRLCSQSVGGKVLARFNGPWALAQGRRRISTDKDVSDQRLRLGLESYKETMEFSCYHTQPHRPPLPL